MALADVPRLVRAVKDGPASRHELVALLDERHAWCASWSRTDALHVRGYVLAAFEQLGLPDAALPFALEELQSGHDPYAIAGAARALRGISAPSRELEPLLRQALDNLSGRDEVVSFGTFEEFYDPQGQQTAGDEVRRTLASLNAAPLEDCCALPTLAWGRARFFGAERESAARARRVVFEDQSGRRRSFDELFIGHPTVLAFFYTRCENPRKCSLTVSKLALVQDLLRRADMTSRVEIAAVSYDADYDTPQRLGAYVAARGLRLDDTTRVLRTSDLLELRAHFRLGVGLVRGVVTRHRIELFVLDARGRVAASFTRLEWNEVEVVERCRDLLHEQGATSALAVGARPALTSVIAPVLMALWPKCPLCWSAYASVLGIAGLERLPYPAFAVPALFGLVVINVGMSAARARAAKRYGPLACTLAGAALLAPLAWGQRLPLLTLLGLLLTSLGALLGAVRGSWPLRGVYQR